MFFSGEDAHHHRSTASAAGPLGVNPIEYLSSYLENVMTTSHPFVFAAFNFMFFLLAVVVTTVMETMFPHLAGDLSILGLLAAIEPLAGFVYFKFLATSEHGYIEPVQNYLTYLQTIEKIAMRCAAESIERIYPFLLMCVDFDFMRGEPIPEQFLLMQPLDPQPELKAEIENMSIGDATRHTFCRMQHVFKEDGYGQGAVGALFDYVQLWEASQMITPPQVVSSQNTTFMVIWFGVWVPITIWVQLGTVLTLTVFPIIGYALFGVAIQRYWLGSVWDSCRSYRESKHEEWPRVFKRSIQDICEKRSRLHREQACIQPGSLEAEVKQSSGFLYQEVKKAETALRVRT